MTNPLAVLARPNNSLQINELHRFAEFGRLSASLLHEISNPLTAASLHLSADKPLTPSQLKHARHNLKLLERYVEAARQQLRQAGQVSSFAVRPELEQVRRILGPYAKRAGVRLVIETGGDYHLWGDSVKFQQIVANLVANAVDAYRPLRDRGEQPADATVSLHLYLRDQYLVIEVRDEGVGMTPAEIKHIFEAFYTTKVQAGYGLGIGLTAVKQYVEHDFGGSIQVKSDLGQGTCFIVQLRQQPLAQAQKRRRSWAHATPA
jgi:two-component system C4-dicarboxylate transport sensor histidine kinase DctB